MVFIKKPLKPGQAPIGGSDVLDSPKLSARSDDLPEKIPDLLKDVDEQFSEDKELCDEIEALLKDIEINVKIGDFDLAKKYYRQLLGYYTRLSNDKKKVYYDRIMGVYRGIKRKGRASFFMKLFSRKR